MIRKIAGRNNQSVKLAAKLQKKKYRRERGLFVVEGFDLLMAGIQAGESPREILVREDLLPRLPEEMRAQADDGDLDIGVCPPEVLSRASALGGAADVVAFFPAPHHSLGDVGLAEGLCVYLAGVGDPGNVGTIVRSAAAFGARGVMLAPGSADPYSPKALRAGMGAHFGLPVVPDVSPGDLLAKLDAEYARTGETFALVLADPHGEESLPEADVPRPAVLVLGEERGDFGAVGAASSHPGLVVKSLAVPQAAFDSLNVAMAATVFLYELTVRGRMSRVSRGG